MYKHLSIEERGHIQQGLWQKKSLRQISKEFGRQPASIFRETNENTNGLIRDYFPKKTDFSMVLEEEIQQVEYLFNNRPRKRLGWFTPLEAFSKELNGFNIILNTPSVALAG